MGDWHPHVTVATVVLQDDRYLLVEERDNYSGALVFNQPAGHLEQGETLVQAALRETLEETGWEVELQGVLGIALYTAPANHITYCRHTFLGRPLRQRHAAAPDADIHRVHWLDYGEIIALSARMRSPMVLAAIEQQRRGSCYPLDIFYDR